MKKLLFLLCLLTSVVINAQGVDYSHFSKKTMNKVMFVTMNDYVKSINNGDSLSLTSLTKYHNRGKDGFIVSCANTATYQDIAKNYIYGKKSNGETFFMDGDYKNKVKVVISNRYNKKDKSIKISINYLYD